MSSQAAAQLSAFNTADALVDFEKRAIEQGRLCNLASYSDYRAYVHLPRPAGFADISKDPRVVEFLKNAYTRSAAPTPNTTVYMSLILTPSAPTMVRLEAPARTSMPRRVRVTTYHRMSAVDKPTTRMATR